MCLAQRFYRNIHFRRHTAGNREVGIDVILNGRVAEVNLRVMPILLLRQIKCKLIVDGEVVVATALLRVTMIMICRITFLTVIAGETFCAAITLARLRITR